MGSMEEKEKAADAALKRANRMTRAEMAAEDDAKGYAEAKKYYEGKQGDSGLKKFGRKIVDKVTDPVFDALLPGDKAYTEGTKRGRKEVVGYKEGGAVRGAGCAQRGVKKCKIC